MKFILILVFSLKVYSEKLSFWNTIELTKKENPVLLLKKFEVEKSKAEIITAGILPNPNFNNQTLYQTKNKGGGVLSGGNRQDWFQVTQVIPVANQREYSIEFAKKNLELAKNNLLEEERLMLFIVMSKWLESWYNREKIKSFTLAKEFLDELIQFGDKKNKDKNLIEIELTRTKILSSQFGIYLETFDRLADNSEASLIFYLNKQTEIEIDDTNFFKYNFDEKKIKDYISIGLKKRSDILLAKSSKSSAISKLRLEEAFAYPRPEVGIVYNPQNNDQYVGSFLTLPIPINNRNQGNIQRAKVDLIQADKEIDYKEKQIELEIKNAYREFFVYRENYEKYKSLVYDSDQIRNKIEDMYLKGKTSYVDYLEAQNDWFEMRIYQLENYYNLKKSFLNVIFVTGLIQDDRL